MARLAASHLARLLPFLATFAFSHENRSQGFCEAQDGECPESFSSYAADSPEPRAASLMQVQKHSWRNREHRPSRRSAQAYSPTSLPTLRHQSLYGEEADPAEQAEPAEQVPTPTSLPPMRHKSLSGVEKDWAERTGSSDNHQERSSAPCACEADGLTWQRPAARPPRCIFIDLGAADGNTFKHFLKNGYGEVRNCPSGGEYEAILVEANPIFDKPLRKLEARGSGRVRSLVSSAAYMCEGFTSFYLDTIDVKENFWGSSMSPNARDVKRSGQKHVKVPLVNVARLIMETALPEDYVLVKVDIEGSEHDIVPCLAQSKAASLIDALYVEKHPVEWSIAGARQGALQAALADLGRQGVLTPEYDTPSL